MKKMLLVVPVILFVVHGSGCIDTFLSPDKPFETSKVGEVLDSGRDGSLVKIHKDYVLFDSGGSYKDDICKVDRKGMKEILEKNETMDNYTSSDYYNLGDTCFEGLIKTIYSSNDFLLIIPVYETDGYYVIDCNKKNNKSLKHYKKAKDIPINYQNLIKIDCSYNSD